MAEFADAMSRQRDKITKLLNRRAPTSRDIAKGQFRMMGGTPYAESVKALGDAELGKAMTGYKMLSNERDFGMREAEAERANRRLGLDVKAGQRAEERLGLEREAGVRAEKGLSLRERQVDLQEAEIFLENANRKAKAAGEEGKAFLKWMDIYKDIPPQERAKLALGARQKLKTGEYTNMDEAFSATATELELTAPPDLTNSQQATNSEIDTYRDILTRLEATLPPGKTLAEEIQERSTTTDELGRKTTDYNSYWARVAWAAMQAKTGGDPRAETWARKLMGADTMQPYQAPPPRPAPAPEKSFGESLKGFFGFGDETDSLPMNGGKVDTDALVKGKTYQTPKGQYRWDGKKFVAPR